MDLKPQQVRSTTFKTVKKGYDPAEVDSFRASVADALESAQSQSMAMEARARAAVAKLQEFGSSPDGAAPTATAPTAGADTPAESTPDAEVISRTLLLAQRTADATVAEAKTEAVTLTSSARAEAASILDGARTMAGKLIDEAKSEARRSAETERVRAESEVQSLLARRDFLLADVDHLEQYILAQRERLRDAAVSLQELVERVPGGLGDMRRPLLSASADAGADGASDAAPAAASSAGGSAVAAAATSAPIDAEPRDEERGGSANSVDDGSSGGHQSIAATIDDVWRSLGESEPGVAAEHAAEPAAGSFDFDLDGQETPVAQQRPSLDIGGDDVH